MQNALTVIVNIRATEVGALDRYLRAIGNHIPNNPCIDFSGFITTHFARWVIFDEDTNPRLMFTSTHDGSVEQYIGWMLDHLGAALDDIWGRCEGYPGGRTLNPARFRQTFTGYLKDHSYPAAAFFLAYPNRTVAQVGLSRRVHEALCGVLNGPDVEQFVSTLADLPIIPEKTERGAGDVLSMIVSLPARLLLNGLAPSLLKLVSSKAKLDTNTPSQTITVPLDLTERRIVQNELTIICDINPRRLLRLKIVLWLIGWLVVRFGNGTLSNIATVHFARWVIFDDGTRLLFESNYDGTWEQYIGDFIDQAWRGLDLIFNNCTGYPRGGARDSQQFKQAIASHQHRAQIFYSAYPDISVRNIRNDVAISDQLSVMLGQKAMIEWLRRL